MTSSSKVWVVIGVGFGFGGSLSGCSSGDPVRPVGGTVGQVSEAVAARSVCGGPTGAQCSSDKVCVTGKNAGCPGPDVSGVCEKRPTSCPTKEDLVCGCDGNTYANRCRALAAGTSVASLGACPVVDPCQGMVCKDGSDCVGLPDGGIACVPNPCTGIVCKDGSDCVPQPDGGIACVPNPCTGVVCKDGSDCVPQADGGIACVPNACTGVVCKNGKTCVVLPDGTASCQ